MSNKTIEIPDFITVRDLASAMEVSPINVIKELMGNGIMANINQQIDFDTAAIVAEEMGFTAVAEADLLEAEEEDEIPSDIAWRQIIADEDDVDLALRPPVVTMLGHVDHGKTSLLDVIRQSDVQSGEAGGITQHIGAYQAVREGQKITFLDTPGHEAFTAMRARGARSTDIAILVVAADDGVMPQTREAADHARAANVPIIVALNKIDVPASNPPRVMQQLAEIGLMPDEWDGDTMVIPVSAKEKLGIDDLLEAILLVAEDLAPKANPKASPTGTILEAKMEKGRGTVATLLVQNGTLNVGDTILTGLNYGRIKAMYDYNRKRVKEASPSTPVVVSGLNGMPEAGDQFEVVSSEKVARKIVAEREANKESAPSSRATLEEFFSRLQQGETETLNLIINADVQGSVEPIVQSLKKIDVEDVNIEIIRAATGNITENDVMLASASSAIILGFNVDVDNIAQSAAANERVDIRTYSIIYHLLEDVEKALKGLLAPTFEEVLIGRAEVREVFRIRKVGKIAGCYMRTGEGRRNGSARIIRNGNLIHSGKVTSLKHLQENVREIKAGFEFGVNIDGFDDFEESDVIEFFVVEKVSVT